MSSASLYAALVPTVARPMTITSAIGILGGDESGFRPADTLKRSEGAKIVAYLMLGNKAAESMTGSGTKYTDLPANHWAAGYMEYLTSVGVMGGIGDGKIDPDGALTTTAFAKMLLTALGYDAEIEGFGGSDWAINVQKVAQSVDLFDGNNDVSPSAVITREEAALYSFNTLCTPIVEYDSKVSVNVQGANVTVGSSSAKSVSSTNGAKQTISADETPASTGATPVYYVEFAEKYYPDLVLVGQDYQLDDLGRPVHKWTLNNSEIGTYTAKNALVYTWAGKVTAKAVYDLLGKAVNDSLMSGVGGANQAAAYTRGTKLVSFENGINSDSATRVAAGNAAAVQPVGWAGATTAVNTDDLAAYISRTNTTTVNNTGNGSVTELYMDSDRNVSLVTYHTYLFQAVGDYNEKTENITVTPANDSAAAFTLTSSKLALADFPEIAEFKDDDYILATVAQTTAAAYTIQSVAKAEVLTGTVDTYDTGANQSVTIDGTKYSYSKTADADAKNTLYTVGQKAAVVLDQAGYVLAVDQAIVTTDYVFVLDWGSTSNLSGDARAKVIFADGTSGEVTVKAAYDYSGVNGTTGTNNGNVTSKTAIANWGSKNNNIKANLNRWYTFSKDSSNAYSFYAAEAKYTQKDVAFAGSNTGNVDVAYNNKAVFLSGATQLANDDTVMIVSDNNDELSVYTGVKNLPEITLTAKAAAANAYVLYRTSTGYASLVYVDVDGNSTVSGGAGQNLVYVTTYKTQTKTTDNDVYYVYKTLDGTDEVEVQADNNITGGANVYDAAYYVSKNSKDQLKGFTAMPNGQNGSVYGGTNQSTPIAYDDGTLTIGDYTFTVNSDTKVTLVKLGGTAGNAAIMNTDSAKAFEVLTGTGLTGARSIANTLKGYGYSYRFGAKATSGTSLILSEAYITVTDAVAATQITATNGANNTDATRINTALGVDGTYDNVTVNGNTRINTTAVTVGQYQNLVITGNLTVDGDTLDINGNVVVQGNLINSSGAQIDIAATGSLTVGGSITDNGTVNVTGGALTVNGKTGSTIKGSSIHATAGATVTFAGPVEIGGTDGMIEVNGSTLDINGALTVTSTKASALEIKSSSTVEITTLVLDTATNNNVTIDKSNVTIETVDFEQDATITITGTSADTSVSIGETVKETGVTAAVTADAGTTTIAENTAGATTTAGAAIGTVTLTIAKPTVDDAGSETSATTATVSGGTAADSNENSVKVAKVTVTAASELSLKTTDGLDRTYYIAGDVVPVVIHLTSTDATLSTTAADYTSANYSITKAETAELTSEEETAKVISAIDLTTSWTVAAADVYQEEE